jgi:predicted adenine nucleotide alpha hydrolase (AANH) superfamily ATPase
MKANEAPEKIYMSPAGVLYKGDKQQCNDIEYTRTDAFIHKACEYFRRGLEDTKVIDDYRNILVRGIQASYTSVEEFIEDFKNYMKGE